MGGAVLPWSHGGIVYQARARHPAGDRAQDLSQAVRDAMWELFVAVGTHWKTVQDPAPMRSRFDSFLDNRIALMPLYAEYYAIAHRVIESLKTGHGGDAGAAYAELFTREDANRQPPTTQLALTRQAVANEFVVLHTALGGFLAFGPVNWPGYFGGANLPGRPAPYRPL